MTNLDRLKGTPYLIEGLESLLRYWFAPDEPNSEPMAWTEEQEAALDVLPDQVQEIYHVAHRWPRTWNTSRGMGIIRLNFPPRVARWRQTEQGEKQIEAVQVGQYYKEGKAFVFVRAGDEPALQCLPNGWDLSDTSALIPISVPVEEAFISIILMSLVLHGNMAPEPEDMQKATHVFSGRWFENHRVDFFYHHDPYPLLTYDLRQGEGRYIIPAFQPRLMERR